MCSNSCPPEHDAATLIHVKIAVALLAALAAVPFAGAAPTDHAQRYFPLSDGRSWTYDNTRFGGQTRVSASSLGGGLFRLAEFPGAANLRVRRSGHVVYAWDTRQQRWEALFRLGAPKGTTYRVDLPRMSWRQVRVTVASRTGVVRVQALRRTFTGVVRLELRPMPGLADAGMLEISFAPGVGIVSWKEDSIAGPVAHVLASTD